MEDNSPNLFELLTSAQAGDRDALTKLVEMHEPMLVRWSRKRLGYPLRTLEETRDIMNDTWMVVMRKIGSFEYEDSRSFARWLRGIVTRIVLQKANGSHLKRRLLMPEGVEVSDLATTPSTRASLGELQRLRYAELRQFEKTDRVIYRLRMRGFSSTQIADLVGMSDRGVRMRFAKVDARLRLRLKKLLDEPS
ncbi:MAG: RNA polymerase sigma factor (sigma-70 family) [Planctomycetota bacterium]|jgi:RNA polymerase sigma factor (sigma-70 family)